MSLKYSTCLFFVADNVLKDSCRILPRKNYFLSELFEILGAVNDTIAEEGQFMSKEEISTIRNNVRSNAMVY